MKKLFLIMAAFILAAFCISAESYKKTFVKQCAEATQEVLPMDVDEVTVLWGVGEENEVLVYNYAVKASASDFEEGFFEKTLRETLISTMKNTEDATIKSLKGLKVTFEHKYYGHDGKLIADILITPADYK